MSQFAEVFSTMFTNNTENHSIYEKMVGLFCKIFENIETEQLCEIIKLYCDIFENNPKFKPICDIMKPIGTMLKSNPEQFNLNEIFNNAGQIFQPKTLVPETSVPETSVPET